MGYDTPSCFCHSSSQLCLGRIFIVFTTAGLRVLFPHITAIQVSVVCGAWYRESSLANDFTLQCSGSY